MSFHDTKFFVRATEDAPEKGPYDRDASLSAGRGGGVLFIGLMVFGIVRIIRGAAAR